MNMSMRRDGVRYDFSSDLNPLGPPESVRATISNNPKFMIRYPDPDCAELMGRLSGMLSIPERNIVVGAGSSELIWRICMAAGFRRVLMAVPCDPAWQKALEVHGIEISYIYTAEAEGFRLNGEYLDCGDGYDAIFISNPTEPSGRILGEEETDRLLTWCQETDTVLVCDETGLGLVSSSSCAYVHNFFKNYLNDSAPGVGEEIPEVIAVRSLTGSFAIAGLRVGYAVFTDSERAAAMRRAAAPQLISGPSQAAASAAIAGRKYLEKAIALIEEERTFLMDALEEAGLTAIESDANYILFRAPSGLGEELLKRGILIGECSDHTGLADRGGKRWFRIGVRLHEANQALADVLPECLENAARAVTLLIGETAEDAGAAMIAAGLCEMFSDDGYKTALVKAVDAGDITTMAENNDIIVIEAPGSMGDMLLSGKGGAVELAARAGAKVILTGDGDRGALAAQLGGTLDMLDEEDRDRVMGVIINRAGGNINRDLLEDYCGVPILGLLSEEAAAAAGPVRKRKAPKAAHAGSVDICIVKLPGMHESEDLRILENAVTVNVKYVDSASAFSSADAIIIPATDNTLGDLKWMNNSGISDAVWLAAMAGTPVLGICGGFLMLGQRIKDPMDITNAYAEVSGIGLLPIESEFTGEAISRSVRGNVSGLIGDMEMLTGSEVFGYEVPVGNTHIMVDEGLDGLDQNELDGGGLAASWLADSSDSQWLDQMIESNRPDNSWLEKITPFCQFEDGSFDGVVSGNVMGTYLKGLFSSPEFLDSYITMLNRRASGSSTTEEAQANAVPEGSWLILSQEQRVELAGVLRNVLDTDGLYEGLGLDDLLPDTEQEIRDMSRSFSSKVKHLQDIGAKN